MFIIIVNDQKDTKRKAITLKRAFGKCPTYDYTTTYVKVLLSKTTLRRRRERRIKGQNLSFR